MKNLTKLTLVAASLMLAGNAFADGEEITQGSSKAKLIGHVPAYCSIESELEGMDFGHNPQAGDMATGSVFVRCNTPGGAHASVISQEGGMVNPDIDHPINYTANWGGVILKSADKEAYFHFTPSKKLSKGQEIGLKVTLDKTPTFAGYYTDLLTVAIEGA